MFERFQAQAVRAVHVGVEEAERRGDPMIGSEHLLVGASNSPYGERLLSRFGITADQIRESLAERDKDALTAVGVSLPDHLVPIGGGLVGRRHRRFTRGAKNILKEALREAIDLGHRRIGVEHLLLAFSYAQPNDEAIHLLTRLDIDPGALRRAVMEDLRASA